jgi:transposase
MLGVVDIEYIRKMHYVEGWSIRKISRQCLVSRQVVRKALRSAESWRYTRKVDKPCPVMDPYRNVITQWIKDDEKAPRKQRHTASRIYHRLCDEYGFRGGESTVRRYVRRLRAELEIPSADPFLVLEADPGEMAQIDWGTAQVKICGVKTIVHLFCMRMRYSKVPFIWAATNERLETFLDGHVKAFNWLGGVPRRIVYDNLTTAIKRILSGHDRELNERLVVLRSHYLFDAVFCNRAAGWEKGSVENLIGYARRNCLTPMPSVDSIEELNTLLLEWCETERQKHCEEWNLELKGLRALPEEAFRACVTRLTTVFSKLSLVTYERNRYSVPCEFIGQPVRIDAFTDRLEIYSKDRLIACHSRGYARNYTSLQLEHYLTALGRKPYAVMNASVVRQLPEPFRQAWEVLCRQSPERYKELVSILQLHNEFSREQIAEAVKRCLRSGYLGFREVKQIVLNERQRRLSTSSTELPASVANVVVPVSDPSHYDVLMEVRV